MDFDEFKRDTARTLGKALDAAYQRGWERCAEFHGVKIGAETPAVKKPLAPRGECPKCFVTWYDDCDVAGCWKCGYRKP